MTFKSHIYDREEIEDGTNWVVIILFLLLIILGYILTDINGQLGVSIIILSGLGATIYLYKDWGKKEPEGKYVGEIALTVDKFTFDKDNIETSEITELKIDIGHSKGFKLWSRFGYTVSSGTNNQIDLITNGQKRSINFQLFSSLHLKELIQILEGLYLKGIFVKEFYLGKRTYLLKDLSYDEIQEFKSKYKLS